ncbi:HEAT repeat domain-containing protein, partial [bacterium]|nr:HEAT repeat domain-containing protein [bacterium]
MNIAVEKKIQSFLEKSASKLLPLMQADVPNKIHSLVALSLARIKTPPCREQVKIYFKNNPDEEDSIKAISLIGGEDAANLLIERIKSKTARNRDVIADELGNFKQPFIIENLKEFLCDEDRHVRYQAANSLFKIGGQSCALAMCKYISDPDEWISMTILKHLCRLKEHETIPFLAEHFARDSDIRRKAIMVSFLSRFKSITLVNIFDEGLKFGDARLKANSIEAIGELELPQREIKLRIAPFIKDPNNRIKANAILALAKSEPNLIQSEIEEMINSSDVQLRRSGAYILGQIPSKGNEDYARQLIEDPSDDVRKRMVLSLRNFSPEFAVSQLERTIFDRNNWNRKYSVDIAKEMPNFPKEPILKQFKSETSAGNLIACMSFFARYPDEEAVRLIKQRVKDKRRAVVCEVIRAIGAIKKIDGLLGIAPQIDQKDPFILKAFVTNLFSLGKIDVFESTLEKAAILKRPPMNDLYLPSIDGCLEILNQGDRIPIGLMNELSGNTSVPTTT